MKVVCRKLDIKNITPKSLRRYFNTALKRGKVDYEIRERLLGHKIDISKGSAYGEILNDSFKLAEYYSDKIESITLLGNGNKKVSEVDKRVNDLEQLNKNLVAELDNTNKKFDDLTDIVKSMSKIIMSLDQAFREETEDDYHLHREEPITYSKEEMLEFRENVKKLNQE